MRYSFPEKLIRHAFFLSVWCLERCADMKPYHRQVAALSQLAPGTVGRELADCLLARQLTLVPGFESHDLKHVLLDYELEPLGEIRLQAFMLGNGNWTLPSVVIFLFGLLLLPQHWRLYRQDFRSGQRCQPIAPLTIEACQHQPLAEVRQQLFSRYAEFTLSRSSSPRFPVLASYALMLVGTAAMLFCFPFLWSANVADLVGAGFPFVAGAIFVVGGLLNLTLQRHLTAQASAVGE